MSCGEYLRKLFRTRLVPPRCPEAISRQFGVGTNLIGSRLEFDLKFRGNSSDTTGIDIGTLSAALNRGRLPLDLPSCRVPHTRQGGIHEISGIWVSVRLPVAALYFIPQPTSLARKRVSLKKRICIRESENRSRTHQPLAQDSGHGDTRPSCTLPREETESERRHQLLSPSVHCQQSVTPVRIGRVDRPNKSRSHQWLSVRVREGIARLQSSATARAGATGDGVGILLRDSRAYFLERTVLVHAEKGVECLRRLSSREEFGRMQLAIVG